MFRCNVSRVVLTEAHSASPARLHFLLHSTARSSSCVPEGSSCSAGDGGTQRSLHAVGLPAPVWFQSNEISGGSEGDTPSDGPDYRGCWEEPPPSRFIPDKQAMVQVE